jgi:hypothetical protein
MPGTSGRIWRHGGRLRAAVLDLAGLRRELSVIASGAGCLSAHQGDGFSRLTAGVHHSRPGAIWRDRLSAAVRVGILDQ